jgi:hypothetical protein
MLDRANAEKILRDTLEDFEKLDKEFDRYFQGRESTHQMMTTALFDTVHQCVFFNAQTQNYDVSQLLQYVPKDDRKLYADVVKHTFQYFQGKPATDRFMLMFKAMLTRYLIRAGF